MSATWLRAAGGAAGLLLFGVALGALWRSPARTNEAPARGLPQAVSFKTAPRIDDMKQTAGVVANQNSLSQLTRYAFLYKDQPAVRALLADVQKKPELRALWQASLDGRKTDEKAAASPAMMDLLDQHTFRVLGAVVGTPRHYVANGQNPADFIPQAMFISQRVPAEMIAGKTYSVTVVMSNVGNTVWTKSEGYLLGAQNPEGNNRWGRQFAELSAAEKVAQGEKATFTFTVTAPAEPGRYDFQWRMCKLGVKWFGLYTPNVAVAVALDKPGSLGSVKKNVEPRP